MGIEYAKAIFKAHSHIKICPVARKGANFSDTGLKDNFSSAQAIRENMLSPLVKANVPEYVLGDLHDFSKQKELFESLCAYSLVAGNLQNLKRIYGCTEGLEHKIFNLRGKSYKDIIKECTSKRYTASRIKRILLANLLNMYKDDVQKYLAEPLYLKPLAASKGRADEILSCLSKAEFKLLLKFNDIENLSEIARKCIEKDIYNFTVNSPTEPFPYMQII